MRLAPYSGEERRRFITRPQKPAFWFGGFGFITPLIELFQRVTGGLAGKEKGRLSEARFIESWKDAEEYAPWVSFVRPATREEDRDEKTDAVITTCNRTWRIQIKSAEISAQDFIALTKFGVVPLWIPGWATPEQVRRRTIDAICDYQCFRIALGLPPETNP